MEVFLCLRIPGYTVHYTRVVTAGTLRSYFRLSQDQRERDGHTLAVRTFFSAHTVCGTACELIGSAHMQVGSSHLNTNNCLTITYTGQDDLDNPLLRLFPGDSRLYYIDKTDCQPHKKNY